EQVSLFACRSCTPSGFIIHVDSQETYSHDHNITIAGLMKCSNNMSERVGVADAYQNIVRLDFYFLQGYVRRSRELKELFFHRYPGAGSLPAGGQDQSQSHYQTHYREGRNIAPKQDHQHTQSCKNADGN